MKCKCPSCHATGSLEMFISHSEASQAFLAVLNLTGELAKPLVKYLGLFRSENRDLSFERTAKLINEIAPDIVAGQIQRNRHTYPAPKKAWVWAINVMLERRELGKLQLPLKNHSYLYEVFSNYKADEPQHQSHDSFVKPAVYNSQPSGFKRMQQKQQQQKTDYEKHLEEHEQMKRQPLPPNVRDLFSFVSKMNKQKEPRTLKGIPVEQLPAYLMGKRTEGETLEDCYQRLKKLEQEENEHGEKTQ